MKLLVVLLNYRTPEMTLEALKASHAATRHIVDCRIDVVDNDSQDGSAERIERGIVSGGYSATRVRLIRSPHNGGFGAGNNLAMRRAMVEADPPEFIYIQNSDAFPDTTGIDALLRHMESEPEVGIAGSQLHDEDETPLASAFRFPSLWSEVDRGLKLGVVSRILEKHVVAMPIPHQTCTVDWVAGASVMLRRAMLEQIGLFDETFFLYFEETDLCRRAHAAGWKVDYVVDSHCKHLGSVSTGMRRWQKVPRYWFDSRRHYFEKAYGRGYFQAANLAFFAGYSIFKFRAALQRKRDELPASFYLDFLRYHFVERPLLSIEGL